MAVLYCPPLTLEPLPLVVLPSPPLTLEPTPMAVLKPRRSPHIRRTRAAPVGGIIRVKVALILNGGGPVSQRREEKSPDSNHPEGLTR